MATYSWLFLATVTWFLAIWQFYYFSMSGIMRLLLYIYSSFSRVCFLSIFHPSRLSLSPIFFSFLVYLAFEPLVKTFNFVLWSLSKFKNSIYYDFLLCCQRSVFELNKMVERLIRLTNSKLTLYVGWCLLSSSF